MPDIGGSLRDAAKLSSVVITIALAIAVGAGGGMLLDRHFGTSPWITVVGFLIGVAAGFRELLRAISRR